MIKTDHSRLAADAILDVGLFDFDRAHEPPFRAKELYGLARHTPETKEYGIGCFVCRARRPLNPDRIHAVLNGDLRRWMAGAFLPWRAASVQRVWLMALKAARGDRQAARAALSALERRRVHKGVARIWGTTHPSAAGPQTGATEGRH